MHGITITYDYDGDETRWHKAVDDFIAAINADSEIAGKFNYVVHKAKEGTNRIHWGSWDVPETVQTLQSRDYFKVFAGQVREFAGGPPDATGADIFTKTDGW